MLFSSTTFLFAFLPLVLLAYFAAPGRARNSLLLLASLLFYGWGEPFVLFVMVASVLANYLLALYVERVRGTPRARLALIATVIANLGPLVYFKYANFLVDNLNVALGWAQQPTIELGRIELPIGISFFTFQIFSYTLDVHLGTVAVQRRFDKLLLYLSFFPQLIAGPIVRYADVCREIDERRTTRADFAAGVRRFVLGLAKKVMLANTLAAVADQIFGSAGAGMSGVPLDELSTGAAWVGIACYTLQIYCDFSGYSDMAIGMGWMFGFRFLENFDYPYSARSITEFWRRWHMSLSTWFRDYLYIPLGGNRGSPARTYRNLLIVFFLCGLWHGASWNFVVWGLFHGAFLVIERLGLGEFLSRRSAVLRHAYVMLAVMVGWVFFRADDLEGALRYLGAMFGAGAADPSIHPARLYLDPLLITALAWGAVCSVPVLPWLRARLAEFESRPGGVRTAVGAAVDAAGVAGLLAVLVGCASLLAAGTHNPFIYFRF